MLKYSSWLAIFFILSMPCHATPLHDAVKSGNLEAIKPLVGMDINAKDEHGFSPLYYATFLGYTPVVKWLLDQGADVSLSYGQTVLTLLHVAANKPIAEMLIAAGLKVNITDQNGATPLHYAKNVEVAEFLIAKGGRIDARDHSQFIPLYYAVIKNNRDLVTFFIKKGASPNTLGNGTSFLYLVTLTGNKDMAELLMDLGADPNFKLAQGKTVLHWASQFNQFRMIKLLLVRGAQVNMKDASGQTPLHLAQSLLVARPLIDQGAEINTLDHEKLTPLYIAIDHGYLDVAKLLLSKGANPDIANRWEQTARQLAQQNHYDELLELMPYDSK